MPVQKWDHVQDPLDVDKKKYKNAPKKEIDTPFVAINETENEEDIESMSQVQSFKAESEQISFIAPKSVQQHLVATSSIQAMSEILTSPITDKNLTLRDVLGTEGQIFVQTVDIKNQPDYEYPVNQQLNERFTQTQQFTPIQRFNTQISMPSQTLGTKLSQPKKEIPIITETLKKPIMKQQINEIVHTYPDVTDSDDYSVTDLKAQFEELQDEVRTGLVQLITDNKEKAKKEVLATLKTHKQQSSSSSKSKSFSRKVEKKQTKNVQSAKREVQMPKQDVQQKQLVEKISSQLSEHSNISQSLLSQGKRNITPEIEEPTPTNEEWFERQASANRPPFVQLEQLNTPSTLQLQTQVIQEQIPEPKQQPVNELSEEQLIQIHRFIQQQQEIADNNQASKQPEFQTHLKKPQEQEKKQEKVEEDLYQWQKQQKIMQKEQDLKEQLYELQRQKEQMMEIMEIQNMKLKQQLTFGFGDNLGKALKPEDLDSQKNYKETLKTQEINKEKQAKEQAINQRKQQSEQYDNQPKNGLHSTQKVFPSLRAGHSLFVGGVLTRDDSQYSLDYKSIRTQGANSSGSKKKIGGLARRKYSKQISKINSKKQIQEDYESERLEILKPKKNDYRSDSQEKGDQYVSSAQIEPNQTQTHSSKIHAYNYEQAEPMTSPPEITSHTKKKVHSYPSKSKHSKELKQIEEHMNTLQAEMIKMDLPSQQPKSEASEELMQAEVPTPAGIEIQTADLNPNLRMQIRRSRKNFQNQVYLDGSEYQLKSQISDYTVKMEQKHAEEQQRLYQLKKKQIQDNIDQIKIYEQEIRELQIENNEEDIKTEKQFTQEIKIEEKEAAIVVHTMSNKESESELSPKRGMSNVGQQLNEVSLSRENPIILLQDQATQEPMEQGNDDDVVNVKMDQGNDPKTRDAQTNAKARDVGLDPMICEKSTDPKMIDKEIDAWKRDGMMQTSTQSKILRDSQIDKTVRAVNESYIKQQPNIRIDTKMQATSYTQISPLIQPRRTTNNGGTQYSLDVVNSKERGPLKQEEQDMIRQIAESISNANQSRSNTAQRLIQVQENDPPISKSISKISKINKSISKRSISIECNLLQINNESKSQFYALIEQNQVTTMIIPGEKVAKSENTHQHTSDTKLKKSTQLTSSNKFQDSMIVNDQIKNVLIDSQNMENSPLLEGVIDKDTNTESKISEVLPVYHDHLIDEILNQKVKNLNDQQAKSREKHRNDSRSTQQMFEHQFGLGKAKDKFGSVKRGGKLGSPMQQNINYIGHQSNFKPLPPIIQERESLQFDRNNIQPNTVKQNSNKFNSQKQTLYSDAQTVGTHDHHMKFGNNLQHQFMNQNLEQNIYDETENCEICQQNRKMKISKPLGEMVPQHTHYQREQNIYDESENCEICLQNRKMKMSKAQEEMAHEHTHHQNTHHEHTHHQSFAHNHNHNFNNYNESGPFHHRHQSLPAVHSHQHHQPLFTGQNLMNQSPVQHKQYNHQQLQYQQQMPRLTPVNGGIGQRNAMMGSGEYFQQQKNNRNNFQNHYQTQHYNQQPSSNQILQIDRQSSFKQAQNLQQPSSNQILQIDRQSSFKQAQNLLQLNDNWGHDKPFINQNSGLNTHENSNINIMDRPQEDLFPIQKYQDDRGGGKQHPLKHFKGKDLEMYYLEKKLKPEVEKEIKSGFFEIRKKFNNDDPPVHTARGGLLTQTNEHDEEVQVYISHICLQNYHPIFCKMNVETVKIILKYSQIVYLNKGQTLYGPGFNENFFYIILFGKCQLNNSHGTQRQFGSILNIGWTIGEEILFKTSEEKADKKNYQRKETCKSVTEACVLGIKKRNLTQIKKCLYERAGHEEFSKIEIVLRGNHLVKKDWR